MDKFLQILTMVIFPLLAFIASALIWEFVAWWMHKYVMHGIGWFLHKDHHRKSGKRLQRNDAYALFFALCSFLLIFNGLKHGIRVLTASGFGIALYGAGYIIFHDVIFHKRIRWIRIRPKSRYLTRIITNHRLHHSVVTKEGADNFGFLWAPGSDSKENKDGQAKDRN